MSRTEISFWVGLIVIAITVAVSWGQTQQQIAYLGQHVHTLESKIEASQLDRLAIESRLASIETKLVHIQTILEKEPK